MTQFHTIRIVRACVVNRKPRAIGELVEDVRHGDQIALCGMGKAELVAPTEAAPKKEAAEKAAPKKAAKKAAKKATKKAAKKG